MARVSPLNDNEFPAESLVDLKQQLAAHGRLTNMKRTLASAPTALHALMEWYPLRDALLPFLGERLAVLFAHAVSSQADCLICSTYFRRVIIDSGENPDSLQLDERENAVVEFGRQLARDANGVSDELYERLSQFLEDSQIVTLTAFGGLMIATNVFNNALRVDLDEYLWPYRRPGAAP